MDIIKTQCVGFSSFLDIDARINDVGVIKSLESLCINTNWVYAKLGYGKK